MSFFIYYYICILNLWTITPTDAIYPSLCEKRVIEETQVDHQPDSTTYRQTYEDWKSNKNATLSRSRIKYPYTYLHTKKCGLIGGRPRIINGKTDHRNSFPWHVQIIGKNSDGELSTCGGTLLSNYWVLTAAHCVFGPKMEIFFGRVLLKNGLPDRFIARRKVDKSFVHEDYSHYTADIALLRLRKSVSFSRSITPACLPERAVDLTSPDVVCYIHGYGRTKPGKNAPLADRLQYMKVKVMPKQYCYERLKDVGKVIAFKLLCLALPQDSSGQCKGDSGSALSCYEPGSALTVQGIIAFVERNCYKRNLPDYLIDVWTYIPWIRKIVIQEVGRLPAEWYW